MSRSRIRALRTIFAIGIGLVAPKPGLAQQFTAPPNPTTWGIDDKFNYHLKQSVGPLALLGDVAYSAVLQEADAPREWGQGGSAYTKRFASTVATSGIHSALAFGLDSALHEDPRYYRATSGGFLQRAGHALRGTILTHTDTGTETLSMWRLGSAYGAAYLSNQWYPDRLNSAKLGFTEGSLRLGFDLASNLASEFWPDIKRKIGRKN